MDTVVRDIYITALSKNVDFYRSLNMSYYLAILLTKKDYEQSST